MPRQDKWEAYTEHGRRAISTHPDYETNGLDGLDYLTYASDTIASILHAARESLTPDDIAAGGEFDPKGLLEGALRCYQGDFEDKPRFTIHRYDGDVATEPYWWVADHWQVGSDGERLQVGRYSLYADALVAYNALLVVNGNEIPSRSKD